MRASLSDAPEKPPEKSKLARNTAIAATVLLAPGGFILGGLLIAHALKKRRDAAVETGSEAKTEAEAEAESD